MKRLLPIVFSLLTMLFLSPCGITAEPASAELSICDILKSGSFRTEIGKTAGTGSLQLDYVDSNSGKLNSELVIMFKPVWNVSSATLLNAFRENISKRALSSPSARSTSARKDVDIISTVSIYGHNQGTRVRIEADAIKISDGSVRLKVVCVTSKESDD